MNELIRDIDIALLMYLKGERSGVETRNNILSLMGENEIGVSDAPERKHGALHDVGGSHASGESTTLSEHTNGAALEKITEAKELYCPDCTGTDLVTHLSYIKCNLVKPKKESCPF